MPPPGPSPEYNQQQQHQPLPTPRTLLTSLLNSLSISPPASNSNSNPNPNPKFNLKSPSTNPLNPLKPLSKAQKSLLVTLHVIFPPPTLLQALDLLDRGLVTRVYISPSCIPRGSAVDQNIPESKSDFTLQNEDQESIKEKPVNVKTQSTQGRRGILGEKKNQSHRNRENILYQVRSAQEHSKRSKRHNENGGLVYTVRLEAWQCSCAAFAYAAFPRGDDDNNDDDEPDVDGRDIDLDVGGDGDGDYEEGGTGAWGFGGLSFDGKGTEKGVPVCKHLLACLLAERWEGVFGGYVKEREVGREGSAGIGGA